MSKALKITYRGNYGHTTNTYSHVGFVTSCVYDKCNTILLTGGQNGESFCGFCVREHAKQCNILITDAAKILGRRKLKVINK